MKNLKRLLRSLLCLIKRILWIPDKPRFSQQNKLENLSIIQPVINVQNHEGSISMFQPQLNQIQTVQKNMRDIFEKTVKLSSKAYSVGFLDFSAVEVEREIRNLENQTTSCLNEAETANKSLISLQKQVNLMKNISKADLELAELINKTSNEINMDKSMTDTYLTDMLTFLSSRTIVGAIMNSIRGIQYTLQAISIGVIDIVSSSIPQIASSSPFGFFKGAAQRFLPSGNGR
jgi:hypothetical protein